jgi:hypothetical protein
MSTTDQGDQLFDSQEITTLNRFKRSLDDTGVQARLSACSYIIAEDAQVASRVLAGIIGDVQNTNVDAMYEAGVSLEMLVDVARETGMFPEDMLPSQETVDRCLDLFWDSYRNDTV